MPKVEAEIWQSSHNRHEKHYFLRDGQHAYQDGAYLFGLNPARVTAEQERKILEILGIDSSALTTAAYLSSSTAG